MSLLEVRDLSKRFPGTECHAVRTVSMDVEEGEILALVGESGCGKTTMLRMIAGLERPSSGEIRLAGHVISTVDFQLSPEERGIGMVFQDYALFPHLRVLDNVTYGLHRLPRGERRERADEILELVGMSGYGRRYPHELSGGQQQRVALARALAPRPALLLLDEPFSNLDVVLKAQVREDIGRILRETGTTALFVVHDSEDVLAIADRLAILRSGCLQQTGSPESVYLRPRNEYVARFFGKTNVLAAEAVRGGFRTPLGFIPSRRSNGARGPVLVAIRPENLDVSVGSGLGISGVVRRITFRGIYQELLVSFPEAPGGVEQLTLHLSGERRFSVGDILHVHPKAEAAQVLGESEAAHLLAELETGPAQ